MATNKSGCLGMKWFSFFTKIRPWINFVFCFLYTVTAFVQEVSIFDFEYYGALVLFNVLYAVGCLTNGILHLILFFVRKRCGNQSLLRFIRALLVFDIFLFAYTYALNQFYFGKDYIEILVVAIVVMIVEYLVWYRLNMNYFKKRLAVVKDMTETAQHSLSLADEEAGEIKKYGNYNIYASDIRLAKEKAPERKETPTTIQPENQEQYQAIPSNAGKVRYCSKCGCRIDRDSKKCTGCGKQYFKGIRANKGFLIVLAVLLTLSVALNVFLYFKVIELDKRDEIAKLRNSIELLESSNEDLREENSDLMDLVYELRATLVENSEELDFFNEYIVFVEDDGTEFYHKYFCSKFIGNYFWAFNVDAAIQEGYSPCPNCCK